MTHSAFERNDQMLLHLSKGYQVMGPNGGVDSELRSASTKRGVGIRCQMARSIRVLGTLPVLRPS